MRLRQWLLFVASQLFGMACLDITNSLFVRRIGGVFLLPGSSLLLAFGDKFADRIVSNVAFEGAATCLFFGINALSWFAVANYLNRRKRTQFAGAS